MRAIFGIANAITLVGLWRSSINLQFLRSTVLGHPFAPSERGLSNAIGAADRLKNEAGGYATANSFS